MYTWTNRFSDIFIFGTIVFFVIIIFDSFDYDVLLLQWQWYAGSDNEGGDNNDDDNDADNFDAGNGDDDDGDVTIDGYRDSTGDNDRDEIADDDKQSQRRWWTQ